MNRTLSSPETNLTSGSVDRLMLIKRSYPVKTFFYLLKKKGRTRPEVCMRTLALPRMGADGRIRAGMKRRKHSFWAWSLALAAAAVIGGGTWLWCFVDNRVQPLLKPMNPAYAGYDTMPAAVQGLALRPFTFTGWDNAPIQAVEVWKDGEESSRQLSVIGELTNRPADALGQIDYVLVCVDWDHGILSALPLAEALTAAGLHCVLWNPRGAGDCREYCTHGLREAADVSALLDALVAESGKSRPVVVAVGQGFGANLLLRAAAHEPRILGLVSIDAFASLSQSVGRLIDGKITKVVLRQLMDMRINSVIGMESFDVAPVQSASEINRNVPVLVVNLVQDNPVSNIDDATAIYRRLRSDCRELWATRTAEDDADDDERKVEVLEGPQGKEQVAIETIRLLNDEEAAIVGIIHWLNDTVVPAVTMPPPADLPRPVPNPDSKL